MGLVRADILSVKGESSEKTAMELDAAIKLLTSILFKRGESTKEKEVEALVRWARKKNKIPEPTLLISITEWR